jgi:hypothetical protein
MISICLAQQVLKNVFQAAYFGMKARQRYHMEEEQRQAQVSVDATRFS